MYLKNTYIKQNYVLLVSETPFGYLPLLEADGKMLNSSVAIARLIAKVVGMKLRFNKLCL